MKKIMWIITIIFIFFASLDDKINHNFLNKSIVPKTRSNNASNKNKRKINNNCIQYIKKTKNKQIITKNILNGKTDNEQSLSFNNIFPIIVLVATIVFISIPFIATISSLKFCERLSLWRNNNLLTGNETINEVYVANQTIQEQIHSINSDYSRPKTDNCSVSLKNPATDFNCEKIDSLCANYLIDDFLFSSTLLHNFKLKMGRQFLNEHIRQGWKQTIVLEFRNNGSFSVEHNIETWNVEYASILRERNSLQPLTFAEFSRGLRFILETNLKRSYISKITGLLDLYWLEYSTSGEISSISASKWKELCEKANIWYDAIRSKFTTSKEFDKISQKYHLNKYDKNFLLELQIFSTYSPEHGGRIFCPKLLDILGADLTKTHSDKFFSICKEDPELMKCFSAAKYLEWLNNNKRI